MSATPRKPSNRDVRALRLIAVENGLLLTITEEKRVYVTAASGIPVPNARRLISAGWLVPDKNDALFGALPQRWRVRLPMEGDQ